MIRLMRRPPPFPRAEAQEREENSWHGQWKHLPRKPLQMVRNTLRGSLRTLRD